MVFEIVLTILFAVLAAFCLYMYAVTNEDVRELEDEITELKSQIQRLKFVRIGLENLEFRMAGIQRQIDTNTPPRRPRGRPPRNKQ